MSEETGEQVLGRAREAVARGQWQQAYELLLEADARALLGAADLPFLAQVAYAAGHLDATVETWERVYAERTRAGDPTAAAGAAVRVAMHLLFDTALMAPVRGWLTRADRCLEGSEVSAVHAWLGVVRSYERLLSGDLTSAREWARQAVEFGSGRDPAAAALGRVAQARHMILGGEVEQGLTLLGDAGVATVSGELDALTTGVVYCELVCALQALGQYDLAEEWTRAMERWCQGHAIGSLHGRCRVHRAEILRLRGAYPDAEQQALLACEELRPYLRRELGWPLTELGKVRLRAGDLRGAEEAFVAADQLGWDAQPGLALVHLAQGNVGVALSMIRDALQHPSNVPSKELPPNNELRRAPLLGAQVEIELAAGELAGARQALEELEQIASCFASKALAGSAAYCRGRVLLANGDAAGARHSLDRAARAWQEVGAPYEVALARSALGDAYRAEGNEQRALLELGAARKTFEDMGVTPTSARAGEPGPPRLDSHVFRCEGDTWLIGFAGHSVRLRDLKGLRYMARLLAEPGRELHVLELVRLEGEANAAASPISDEAWSSSLYADSGVMLDARAKEAYRRRLAEIEQDIDEASALADLQRIAQSKAERDFISRELSRAVGLGGRDRHAGAASERARASVTRAIRQAMSRIGEHNPGLGEHLERALRTGTYCVYQPEPRADIRWSF